MKAEIITGAEIAIRSLQKENVKFVFGYPGGAVLNIYDAIFQQSSFKHVLVRHEQAAVHAADAYSRATGSMFLFDMNRQPFMQQMPIQEQQVM